MVQEAGGVTSEVIAAMPGHALAYQKSTQRLLWRKSHCKKAQEAEMAYWKEQAALEDAGEEMQGQQQRRCVLYLSPTDVGKTSRVKAEVIGRKQMKLFEKKAKGSGGTATKTNCTCLSTNSQVKSTSTNSRHSRTWALCKLRPRGLQPFSLLKHCTLLRIATHLNGGSATKMNIILGAHLITRLLLVVLLKFTGGTTTDNLSS